MNPLADDILASASLGVRTADGSIAPVLDLRRALSGGTVFTTTADGQRRAVFDFFYRGAGAAGWIYLDSLSLPHIPPAPAGEPDLRVEARLDSLGNLQLQMHDPRSGQPARFLLEAARLQRLLRSQPGALASSRPAIRSRPSAAGAIPPATDKLRSARARKRRRLLLAALGLAALGLAALGLAPAFLAGGRESGRHPLSLQASSEARETSRPESGWAQQPEGAQQPEPGQRALLAPASPQPAGPASSKAVSLPPALPASPPRAAPLPAGLPASHHSIAWGDTLWRIAERYYGERKLYRELAKSNRLEDPDRIIAGDTLLLPPALAERRRKAPGEQP